MKTIFLKALPLGFMLGFAPSIWATPFIYNFDNPTGTLGVSQTYTDDGVTLTAYGYNEGIGTKLFGKNDGGDENGLGLFGTSDHEITSTGFVQLDMLNLWLLAPTSISLSIGSVQHDESWIIFGSNAQGTLGTQLLAGSVDAPATFSLSTSVESYRYLSVTASSGDVLFTTFSANTGGPSGVPEPGSMILLGTGLLGMAAMMRRFRRA